MIVDELERLVAGLRALGRPVVDQLLPGATRESLDAAGVTSSEIRAWFAWQNGVNEVPRQTQDDISLIPGYWPLSLEEALAMKPAYDADPVLGEFWIPLLASGGGDLYAAVWSEDSPPAVAGILVGEPTEIEFPDLETMLRCFCECFETGAYFVDADGRLVADPDLYDQVYDTVVESG